MPLLVLRGTATRSGRGVRLLRRLNSDDELQYASAVELGQVIEQLQLVGMSGYEAKAYVALVAAGQPLNGYEVAKRSGVPRSTVYESLGKLVKRGAAFEVRNDEGNEYIALPVESLLGRLRRTFDSQLEALGKSLPAIEAPPQARLVHHLRDQAVIDRARDLITGAREDLFASIWPEEAELLVDDLVEAGRRGVDVLAISFGETVLPVAAGTLTHKFSDPDTVYERVGCRLLVLAADRRSVLITGATDSRRWGVYSDDPAVVLVAVEFVRHDMAFEALVDHMGTAEVLALWQDNPTLQRLATGRAAPANP